MLFGKIVIIFSLYNECYNFVVGGLLILIVLVVDYGSYVMHASPVYLTSTITKLICLCVTSGMQGTVNKAFGRMSRC